MQRLVDILDLAAKEGCGLIFDDIAPSFIKKAPLSKKISAKNYKAKPGYGMFFVSQESVSLNSNAFLKRSLSVHILNFPYMQYYLNTLFTYKDYKLQSTCMQ